MRTRRIPSWGNVLVVGILLGSFCGCKRDDAPVLEFADVTGKVSYNGEGLKKGTVMFQPPSGAIVVGNIQPDGTYTLKGVIGPNTVMIESRDEETPMTAENRATRVPPKSYVPEQYSTPASGLTYEVKAGSNTADFDLK